ncbi:hypothetical protein P1X15_15435 [Runella sp. MFBS21]|uniref:hypothetical protein n=1 Tax=Runella sp. MFBS21 TaxID=3034018 RepID=UPI0023F92B77|nr:hypothetical protein [Runella sp. MFBS21]MDF7819009.1 hypothetical protein [Runella sp. MFBS21]
MSTKIKPHSVVKSRISPNVKKRLIASGKIIVSSVSLRPTGVAIQPALPDSPLWRRTFFGKYRSLNEDKMDQFSEECAMNLEVLI